MSPASRGRRRAGAVGCLPGAGGDEQKRAEEARAPVDPWHADSVAPAPGSRRRSAPVTRLAIEWRPVTRFQKLAAATLVTALGLVTIGVIVRVTDSGLGCPDWPFCYGKIIPPLDDGKAWIEWIHRTVAAVIGIMILALAFLAVRDHRDRRSIVVAVVRRRGTRRLPGLARPRDGPPRQQRRVGHGPPRERDARSSGCWSTSRSGRASRPASPSGGSSQRFTLLAAFGAIATYALLLFGSNVTATSSALVFPDWPLMGGTLFPAVTDVTSAQVLHRYVAAVVGVIVLAIAIIARRTQRDHPALVRLAVWSAVLYGVQIVVGGLQILDARGRLGAGAAPRPRDDHLGDARGPARSRQLLHCPGDRSDGCRPAGPAWTSPTRLTGHVRRRTAARASGPTSR